MSVEQMIDQLFEGRESKVARDLKINLKSIVERKTLGELELGLNFIALGKALNVQAFDELGMALIDSSGEEISAEQLLEAKEVPAIMGMMNIYYRFRHFAKSGGSEFGPAGLRQQSLAQPLNGKKRFETMAFSISILNGCEMCIFSHEKELKNHGLDVQQIHELARLTATAFAVKSLLQ